MNWRFGALGAFVALGTTIGILFVATMLTQQDRKPDSFDPPFNVVLAMHNGFRCWAEDHSNWPKGSQYEWLCK